MSLTAYADADHAGCQDTRCSTSKRCLFLGVNLFSWSQRRKEQEISSTEANYIALFGCCVKSMDEFNTNRLMVFKLLRFLCTCDNSVALLYAATTFNIQEPSTSIRIMSSITAQQAKLDLELVPKEKRLDIRKCNERLNPGKIQREPTF
ncbi:retrovirus-related pol polyprotein from transposon TNT 1-94 [Tanacetum coccineum]